MQMGTGLLQSRSCCGLAEACATSILLFIQLSSDSFHKDLRHFSTSFFSIKKNLVCAEQIARESNLCMKAYHSKDMTDRSTQLSAWLLRCHKMLSAQLDSNSGKILQSLTVTR